MIFYMLRWSSSLLILNVASKIDFTFKLISAKILLLNLPYFIPTSRSVKGLRFYPMCKLISYSAKSSCIPAKMQDSCMRQRAVYDSQQQQ